MRLTIHIILLHEWEGNIQFEGGSIGPTAGRDNTKPENCIVRPKRNYAIIDLLYDSNLVGEKMERKKKKRGEREKEK